MRHTPDISPAITYIRQLFAPEDTALRAAAEAAHTLGQPIHIGAEEGKFLQFLVQLHQPKKIIEIGTLTGYSALWMARALPKGGHLWSIEKSPTHHAAATQVIAQSDVADRITLLHGDAHTHLAILAAQAPFDMIFIDADKISYPHYLDWAEENLRPGGLIVGDNTLLLGAVMASEDALPQGVRPATAQAMRLFNARLANPERYHSTLIPTQEGLTIALKR